MANSEILNSDGWENCTDELEIYLGNTFLQNNNKTEIYFHKLSDKMIPPDNSGDVSETISDENYPEATRISSREIISPRNANFIPKLITLSSGKDERRTVTEDKNVKIMDCDDWENLADDFEILSEEESKNKQDVTFSERPEGDKSITIGEVSAADIVEDFNVNCIEDDSSFEIVSQQNANVISVMCDDDLERTVLVHLCQKIRSNTKWIMEYNEHRGQKPKITLTKLGFSKQRNINNNRSALMCGLMATNILCFALGFSIGWWNREFVPTYAIFEFDLGSVVY